MEKEIYTLPLGVLIEKYPVGLDFLKSYRLEELDRTKPLPAAIEQSMPESLDELGFSALDVVDLLVELIKQTDADSMDDLKIIEIIGGTDKDGKPDRRNRQRRKTGKNQCPDPCRRGRQHSGSYRIREEPAAGGRRVRRKGRHAIRQNSEI